MNLWEINNKKISLLLWENLLEVEALFDYGFEHNFFFKLKIKKICLIKKIVFKNRNHGVLR